MNVVQAFLQILKAIWDGFFSLRSPFFDLTFKQIFIGIFIVLFSVTILWQLLGIGGSIFNDIEYGVRYRVRGSRMRRNRSSFKRSNGSSVTSSPSDYARPNSNKGYGGSGRRASVGSRGSKPLGGKGRSI